MSVLDLSRVGPGLADPVHDAQRIFRGLMHAMSRPGVRVRPGEGLAPVGGLSPAAAAVALTLLDGDTPVWLAPHLSRGPEQTYLQFHCGVRMTSDPADAAFAFADATQAPLLSSFQAGDEKYPDRSTTLVLQCSDFDGGQRISLAGPGVRGRLAIAPVLPPDFLDQWRDNHARFQCGVDVILVCGVEAICLPRSVAATAGG